MVCSPIQQRKHTLSNMNIQSILSVTQLIIAIALIVLVLLQERGGGVGSAFGGGDASFQTQRRGLEKWTYSATIAGLIIFAALSLALLLL